MKKLWKLTEAFAACAAALCLTAAAVENTTPVKVWGEISPWDGEGIFLKNSEVDNGFHEVVVHLGDAPVVDAVTGLPLEAENRKEGDTLYAWISPAMTLSLPPQVNAVVAVGNVPADTAAPEYYEIAENAVYPGGKDEAKEIEISVLGGEKLRIPTDVEIGPWLTRQVVTLEDLVPGARILVWKDAEGKAEKIIVFAYAYEGYLNMIAASHGDVLFSVNNDTTESQYAGKRSSADGTPLAPVRLVAEAAGYDVRWDKELGAVVSRNGKTVLSVKPGAEVMQVSEGEVNLSAPCVLEKGVTYLPAADLAHWLNLFFVEK